MPSSSHHSTTTTVYTRQSTQTPQSKQFPTTTTTVPLLQSTQTPQSKQFPPRLQYHYYSRHRRHSCRWRIRYISGFSFPSMSLIAYSKFCTNHLYVQTLVGVFDLVTRVRVVLVLSIQSTPLMYCWHTDATRSFVASPPRVEAPSAVAVATPSPVAAVVQRAPSIARRASSPAGLHAVREAPLILPKVRAALPCPSRKGRGRC